LAAVFGDMKANKTQLEANRVLREASQAVRSVELADRINALKALKGEAAGATNAPTQQVGSELQTRLAEAAAQAADHSAPALAKRTQNNG
jgi:hypothetical protein